MKLLLRKLGRIEEAEMEIRPLTVLVGKNNTNKTWAAYSLYGLLRYLTWRNASAGVRTVGTSLIKIQTESVRARVEAAVRREADRLPPEGEADTVELDVSRRALLDGIDGETELALKSGRLRTLLTLGDEIHDDARATLRVTAEELRERDATVRLQLGYAQRRIRLHWTSEEPEVSVAMQLGSAEALRERTPILLQAIAQRLLTMGMVLLLPAERKALASTYKQTPDEGRIEEVLSDPVFNFASFLSSIDAQWQGRRGKKIEMPSAVTLLDDRILGGSIDFTPTGAGQRLVFLPRGGPALPMHGASSMVGSLAGLSVYLRYAARPGDTLIVDEPEMNAHPEAQLRLAELLAYLVNQGIRIVLSTHSPYIVDHLNNLIWASKVPTAKHDQLATKFALGTSACFLRKEDVAAYLFEDERDDMPVRVRPIFHREDPENFVDWETFSEASVYAANLFSSEILPRIEDE